MNLMKRRTNMTAELIERCKEVLLLDDARTQGEWFATKSEHDILSGFVYDENGEFCIDAHTGKDAAFIASAPQMAQLLRECLERMEADGADARRYRWLRDHHPQSDVCGTDDREEFDRYVDGEIMIEFSRSCQNSAAILNNNETKK